MKKTIKLICLILALVMLTLSFASCVDKDQSGNQNGGGNGNGGAGDGGNSEGWKPNIVTLSSDSLYVKKVENLPDDFIMGMDASAVPSLEASGVKYYDYDGSEKDVYEILSQNGVNYIRVRIWNDPYDKDGNGYGGGNCDLANAIEIGKRATKYGMRLS